MRLFHLALLAIAFAALFLGAACSRAEKSSSPIAGAPTTDDDAARPVAGAGRDADLFRCDIYHESSTVGLIGCQTGAFAGYTLLAPTMTTNVYLLDMFGYVVHEWPGQTLPGQVVYFLENGQLLRTGNSLDTSFAGGGIGGIVMLQEWAGAVTWNFTWSTSEYCAHHDVKMLPNGNILMIVWEKKTPDEAIAAGRNPAAITQGSLWPDSILEVKPVGARDGQIVWQWNSWDHLIQDYDASKANYGVVADHPELLDLNFSAAGPADFMHTNSVDYNAELDQILIGVHGFSEVWALDHSTTAAEAAGHAGGKRGRGGDILYRWGNPQAYRAGAAADEKFYGQHDASWIPNGLPGAHHILASNNGYLRPTGKTSTLDEFVPAVNAAGDYPAPNPAYAPADIWWTYEAKNPTDMYSVTMSGAQRLPNGNTLICVGVVGAFIEVTPAGKIVWKYVNPAIEGGLMKQGQTAPPGPGGNINMVFRAYRYAPDYPGLAGRDLTPGECLIEPCK